MAWGIWKQGQEIKPLWIPRGKCGPYHIRFEMLYCGICHSDVHFGDNRFGNTIFPFVAGQELVGRVIEVGQKVTGFKVGDSIAVGTTVDSCRKCNNCLEGEEAKCAEGRTTACNGDRKHGGVPGNINLPTYGGYSAENVVH